MTIQPVRFGDVIRLNLPTVSQQSPFVDQPMTPVSLRYFREQVIRNDLRAAFAEYDDYADELVVTNTNRIPLEVVQRHNPESGEKEVFLLVDGPAEKSLSRYQALETEVELDLDSASASGKSHLLQARLEANGLLDFPSDTWDITARRTFFGGMVVGNLAELKRQISGLIGIDPETKERTSASNTRLGDRPDDLPSEEELFP